jgi:hypothetical protein
MKELKLRENYCQWKEARRRESKKKGNGKARQIGISNTIHPLTIDVTLNK